MNISLLVDFRHICLFACLVLGGFYVQAQKFGYIDSEYILDQMPEYQKAEKELDKLVEAWQTQINTKKQDFIKAQREYEAEAILLDDILKAEKKANIEQLEQELRDYQNTIFGHKGLLFNKRQELVSPIQDQVYKAIEKVAKRRKIQFLFDKSVDFFIIYSDPKHNYSDDILEELNIIKPESDDTPEEN